MVNPPERFMIARWMPALLVGGLVAALVAAVLVVLAGRAGTPKAGTASTSRSSPYSPAACRHRPPPPRAGRSGFDRRAASRTTLERVLRRDRRGPVAFAASCPERAVLGASPPGTPARPKQVLAARSVAGDRGKAAAESRTFSAALAATGNAVSAPGGLPRCACRRASRPWRSARATTSSSSRPSQPGPGVAGSPRTRRSWSTRN